jgi:hypothetical protein
MYAMLTSAVFTVYTMFTIAGVLSKDGNVLNEHRRQGRPMKKAHFIWAVKYLDLVRGVLPLVAKCPFCCLCVQF